MTLLGKFKADGDGVRYETVEYDDHGLAILDEDEQPKSWLRHPTFPKGAIAHSSPYRGSAAAPPGRPAQGGHR